MNLSLIKNIVLLYILQYISILTINAQDKILMFVSHEETYYSEYIVMHEALTDAGYNVEVRSASTMPAGTYMIPANTTINETANTLPGGSYAQFLSQYENYFGVAWNAALNGTPSTIPVSGSILDVPDMSMYVALVVVGGIGSQAYNVDGSYASQGVGPRLISATIVQNVAEKLNSLAVEAIIAGKPVMGQCHGAGVPAHWRYPVPNNSPLGTSILSGSQATGFPEPATSTTLASLGITFLPDNPVVITSPHPSVPDNGAGNHKIITTRDWYPQTVAHAALTLINILNTFPPSLSSAIDVLIIHGGALDPNNCHYTNRANDIPCNYGTDVNDLPADYTHLQTLLDADSNQDDFTFNVNHVNITGGGLPFDVQNECSMITYFNQYDVIIFYKHWSTGVTPELQNAIVSFADHGGGVVALHHGLYNDIDGPTGYNKDILVNQLFNAQSAQSGWGASRQNFNLINTNLGHFVTTQGVNYSQYVQAPGSWFNNIPLAVNSGYSYYFGHNLFDEYYTNTAFVGNPTIGRNLNEITPLYGIGNLTGSQNFTSGFLKVVDLNNDNITGKVVYLQPGETRSNYLVTSQYGQIIRNAVYWAGHNNTPCFPVTRWNTQSGIWNTIINWTPQRIPRSCDQVFLPNIAQPYTISLPNSSNYTIRSLTLEINANAVLGIPSNSQLIIQH
jgi:putative intracellular protease/amidase